SMNFLGSQGPNHAMRTTRKPSEPMLETFSAMYRFMPWIRAVTAIRVVVARMMPRSVRKLRSLFLRSESRAIRVASQNDAERRNLRVSDTVLEEEDGISGGIVPGKSGKSPGSFVHERKSRQFRARRKAPRPRKEFLLAQSRRRQPTSVTSR